MATITVMLGREKQQIIHLDGKKPYLVGRNKDADIILNNVLVSRHHAQLTMNNGLWKIKDLSGRNGLVINGHYALEQVIHNGDVIEIAKFALTFVQAADELERDRALAQNAPGATYKTSFDSIAGADRNKKLKKVTQQIISDDSTIKASADQLASLRKQMSQRRKAHLKGVENMQRPIYPLEKTTMFIGKAEEADIRIAGGLTVAARHAKISLSGKDWYIEHIHGLAALKVNDVKTKIQKLEGGDQITIGSSKMEFMSGV